MNRQGSAKQEATKRGTLKQDTVKQDMAKQGKSSVWMFLVPAGILLAVYWSFCFLWPLLSPILAAVLFLTMFGPLLQKVQHRLKLHRQVGAVLLLLAAGILLGILLWLLCSWVVGSLPKLMEQVEALEVRTGEILRNICALAQRTTGIDSSYLEEQMLLFLNNGFDGFRERLMPQVWSLSLTYGRKAVGAAGFLVTFLIATVLLAKDYDDILNRLLDQRECHLLLEVICGVIRDIATFVKAQLSIMAIIGTACAVVLLFAGIRQGILWGILAGFLDVLPFVGTGVVLIPLAFGQFFAGRAGQGIACLGLYGGCILLRELLEPKLIGKKIGVAPICILISVYAGIHLFGADGIIKGPLGCILTARIYKGLQKRTENKTEV